MKNLIAIFKSIAKFFIWHYKAVDKLRPDDTANQVMLLNFCIKTRAIFSVYFFRYCFTNIKEDNRSHI